MTFVQKQEWMNHRKNEKISKAAPIFIGYEYLYLHHQTSNIKHQPEIVRQHFEKHLPHRNILISVITLGGVAYWCREKSAKRKSPQSDR